MSTQFLEYEVNEEVEYFCGLCQKWVLSIVVAIESGKKVVVRHEGEAFSVYEDEADRIRKYE
jgi:hypothetical protein